MPSEREIDNYIDSMEEKNQIYIEEELNYASKCHSLEEQLGCPLEDIVEFVKLLKKYYYVDITGQLMARIIWNNTDLNEKELYRINHIFNDIKDKSE